MMVYTGDVFVVEGVGVISDLGRLVGDVLLVEGRRAGCLLPGERALVAWRRRRGRVGGRRGEVDEEGPGIGGRATHEIVRHAGEDVGGEVFGVAPVGDDLAVVVDPVVVELLLVELAVPLVPAGRDVGRVARRVAVEVLAYKGGLVALLLQAGSDRV